MFPPPQAKTAARGYGGNHQKLRREWAPLVATGTVRCWRCGYLILPSQAWDLGHDDADPTKKTYRGPEHRNRTAYCKGNRLAGLIKAANNNRRKAKASKAATVTMPKVDTSRRW